MLVPLVVGALPVVLFLGIAQGLLCRRPLARCDDGVAAAATWRLVCPQEGGGAARIDKSLWPRVALALKTTFAKPSSGQQFRWLN